MTTSLLLLEHRGTAAPAVSPAGRSRIYFDSATNRLRLSENAGAYVNFGLSLEPALVVSQGTTGQTTVTVTQPVNTTGSPTALRVTGGAHTALTASVEAITVAFDLASTVQFSTGALAAQRAVRITAPTYGFVGASTITDTATLAVSGPPIVGASATFTRAAALWIETGYLIFGATAGTTAALAATSGISVQHGWAVRGRNQANSADRDFITYGVAANNTFVVGQANVNLRLISDSTDLRITLAATERVRILSTGFDFNNGTTANYAFSGNAEAMIGLNIAAAGVRNIALFNDGSAAMQSMDGGVYILNAVVVPTGNPATGGYLYSTAGAGTWRGSGGTVTTFGPA